MDPFSWFVSAEVPRAAAPPSDPPVAEDPPAAAAPSPPPPPEMPEGRSAPVPPGDPFAAHVDPNAPALEVAPSTTSAPTAAPASATGNGAVADPPAGTSPAPTPALAHQGDEPRPDPFGRFIDDGAPRGRTPLEPLREATSGPAIDPFASRIVGDARPEPPTPPVFKDPLAARIDPQASAPAPAPEPEPDRDDRVAPAPRFSRRVEAVAVSLRTEPGESDSAASERVWRGRQERLSSAPGYRLGDAVRARPKSDDAPRVRAMPAHRNLLTGLLDEIPSRDQTPGR